MKKLLFSFAILITSVNAFSQEVYHLTLEQSIEIAKEKSYSMLLLAQEMKIAEQNLKATTSRLKTHISLNLTLPNYQETVRERSDTSGVFYSVKQLAYEGRLSMNQPLPMDGNIYLRTDLSTYKDYDDMFRSSRLNTRIGFEQPLNILYGYSKIRSDLKNARLEYERSGKSYQRAELELTYNVSNSYYRLLSNQKQTEIALSNLQRQAEAYEISKNKYEAGLIREVDALQMEVDLAEAQSGYDMAILNQNSSINSFKELIGINLDDSVILSSNLDYKIIQVDPEEAVMKAMQNRTELRERDIDIELNKMSIKQQKMQGLPQGSIDAYYEQTGTNFSREDFNISNSLKDSYDNFWARRPSFGVGFTVSIPLLDFGENRARVRVVEARLKYNEYRKEETQRNIETAVRNLAASISSNLKRLQLLEKNVAVAEKSFDITLQRYSDGDIDSQSLALERNRLNNAYISHLNAYINYQLSIAELMKETLYDFKNETRVE
ncbi:MAG: TolC family protein [Dysgonamonadaceae bacterium]|jgi:outer membrane protein TolC|nr:TolC family protein [Dysgonamonadaceae bacterium]